MDRTLKIVVTGPFDSGKTTFIGTISEIEVVSTERATRGSAGERLDTTVAMDFGRITLPDGYVIHLYGTPGQERFDFMWEILSEGMLGYVVLLDGGQPSTFPEGKRIMKAFDRFADVPYVVGLTRADSGACVGEASVRGSLGVRDGVEILRLDARTVEGVKNVLIRLLELVVERAEVVEQTG